MPGDAPAHPEHRRPPQPHIQTGGLRPRLQINRQRAFVIGRTGIEHGRVVQFHLVIRAARKAYALHHQLTRMADPQIIAAGGKIREPEFAGVGGGHVRAHIQSAAAQGIVDPLVQAHCRPFDGFTLLIQDPPADHGLRQQAHFDPRGFRSRRHLERGCPERAGTRAVEMRMVAGFAGSQVVTAGGQIGNLELAGGTRCGFARLWPLVQQGSGGSRARQRQLYIRRRLAGVRIHHAARERAGRFRILRRSGHGEQRDQPEHMHPALQYSLGAAVPDKQKSPAPLWGNRAL